MAAEAAEIAMVPMHGDSEQAVEASRGSQPLPTPEALKKLRAYELQGHEVTERLHVVDRQGLSSAEVLKRREQYGSNALSEAKTRSAFQIIFGQVRPASDPSAPASPHTLTRVLPCARCSS